MRTISLGLLLLIIALMLKPFYEGFVNYAIVDVRPKNPDVVTTSGMDTLTPLPYWVKYGVPDVWPVYVSPNWFYDIPWTGPIATPFSGIGGGISVYSPMLK